MNILLLEELSNNLRRVANQQMDSHKKEVYLRIASNMKTVFNSMEEQQRAMRSIASISEELRQPNISEEFLQISSQMNRELQVIEDVILCLRRIVNN